MDIWDPGTSLVLCPVHGAHKPNSECYGCPQCRDAILADPPPRLVGPMGKSYMLVGHAYGKQQEGVRRGKAAVHRTVEVRRST